MEERKLTCEEAEELLPEYALGVLDAGETAGLAQHLIDCPVHTASLADYQAVCDSLCAAAPPSVPPASLRARLLAKVSAPPPAPRRSNGGWAFAAAALTAAILLGVWGFSLQRELDRRASAFDKFQALASSPDARMVPLATMPGGGQAKGVLFLTQSEAAIWAIGLPALQGDQVYECWWLDRADHRTSGGTFRPQPGAAVWFIPIPDDIVDYHAFGITLEPNGQTTEPQGPAVMAAQF